MALRAGGKRRYDIKGRAKDGAATRDSIRLGEPGQSLVPDLRKRHRRFEEGLQKEYFPGVQFKKSDRPGGAHGIAPGVVGGVAALPAVYGEPHGDIEKARYIGQAQQLAESFGGKLDATVTDDMLEDIKDREDEGKVAEYHAWLHAKFDYRQPGVAALLQKFEPEFIQSRIDLIKRDLGVEMMDKIINEFGVQSGEDARYLYGRERGMIRTQKEYNAMQVKEPMMFQTIPGNQGMYIPGPLFSLFRPAFFRRAVDADGNAADAKYDYTRHGYGITSFASATGYDIAPGGYENAAHLQTGKYGPQPTNIIGGTTPYTNFDDVSIKTSGVGPQNTVLYDAAAVKKQIKRQELEQRFKNQGWLGKLLGNTP